MDIQDYDLEVDDLEEERPSGRGRKTSKGITAALVLLISILVVLLLIAGALIMAYFTGKYAVVTEDANGELPVYTETQVRDMITEAGEVADKLRADEVEAAGVQAKAQGYALGRNDLLDFIKNTLLSTNSSIETFRLLYPNNIVVVSNSAYHFIEINKSLKLSELVQDRIKVLENGEIQYTDESGNVVNSYPDLNIVYQDASGNRLIADLYDAANITDKRTDPNAVREIDGITVYYDYVEYVTVPDEDYLENTLDPEIRDRVYNDTHFGVIFNSAEEDYCAYSNINFRKGDIYYHIQVRDKELSADELFTVAEEMIRQ